MKGGNASFRYLMNTILYSVIMIIWFDIFIDLFSSNHINSHKSIMEVVPSNDESEHAITLKECNKLFTIQTKELKNKDFIWDIYKCPNFCNIAITDQQYDEATNQFIDCAKKCWSQNNQNYYQIHTKDGIMFKFDNHTFQCFHTKIKLKNYTVVRIGKKNSFKQNLIAEVIQLICKLIGDQSANRIKNILHAQHLPLHWIIPIILIIFIICLYVGYGPGLVDNILSFRNQANQVNRANTAQIKRNHSQKIQYGWRLIQFLHQYQKEKFAIESSKKSQQRKNVKEIKDMLQMINKQQHTAVKLISGNKGVGIQSSINSWIQQKWGQGRDIIHFNLQYQINCLERLGLDNNPLNNLECILNAIIFEKDRNAITMFFTILIMTANYFFKHLLSLLDQNPMLALIHVIVILPISYLTDYIKNQSLSELAMIRIYQIIFYLRILFLLFVSYYYERISKFIKKHAISLKNRSKTVIIIDNFEKMQYQHDYREKLDSLLIKCQQIQEMKKYQVILICRNANFTRQLIQMQVKSNYLKFDKSNVHRLSFSSVKEIIQIRHDKSKQKTMFQRSKNQAFLLSYFYDNAETIFSSMRRLRIDPKYSYEDYYYLTVENPNNQQKKELRKKIFIQINIILQNARFRLRYALDPQNFANYMLAKLPPGFNINHQEFKDRQKNKFQNHIILLQKVLGFGILDLKYDNQRKGAENANKRIKHLNTIKNEVFPRQARPVRPVQFGRMKSEDIVYVQDPYIQAFLYKWYHRSIQNLSQNEFWSLCSENNDRKTVSNIIDYLNDQGIFYFYNFNSLVNALAYFMHLHNLTEIKFKQP